MQLQEKLAGKMDVLAVDLLQMCRQVISREISPEAALSTLQSKMVILILNYECILVLHFYSILNFLKKSGFSISLPQPSMLYFCLVLLVFVRMSTNPIDLPVKSASYQPFRV